MLLKICSLTFITQSFGRLEITLELWKQCVQHWLCEAFIQSANPSAVKF